MCAAALVWLVAGAATANAGDCLDNDGDGFGGPGSDYTACPGGTDPDCDDGDITIYPGAPERCNDDDDDCDGETDEDFAELGEACAYGDPDVEVGPCFTAGTVVCTEDELGTECVPDGPIDFWAPEGDAPTDASCFDGDDNDCDGLFDHEEVGCQTAELCDGFDNDNDGEIDEGFDPGTACTVGVGICERTGEKLCTADGTDALCNAVPGSPGVEDTTGNKCVDGLDNDCDGLVDLADTGCQEPEKCDGLDNDGDGDVDEDFTDLGDPCTVGVGSCQRDGLLVCTGDGTGTECGAAPGLAAAEGPSGPTCFDGIDNDCDGNADDTDADCNSALMSVTCSLPYLGPPPQPGQGRPGDDCTGWHQVLFTTSGTSSDAVVTAELLALDTDGATLAVLPVENGDRAHLASRVDPLDFKATSKRNRHSVFAPVPLLHVTVQDGLRRKEAFCSNIPYLEVVQPADTVVSVSEGDVTEVLVALPLVDVSTLMVKVDGVDILTELGIDPAADFPGGPFAGPVTIGGESVMVSELFVESGSDIATPSSNTLTMLLSGLGCGGHIVLVEGERQPGAFPEYPTPDCYGDDLKDTGTSFVFGFEITTPTAGSTVDADPVPVQGEVCHGRSIASVQINGFDVDVSGEILTPGDGENSADTYTVPIDVGVPQTDLAATLSSGTASVGTFDQGKNEFVADAIDDLGNRTFETFYFNVGQVGQVTLAAALAEAGVGETIALMAADTILNAFVAGVNAQGIQDFISSLCESAGPTIDAAVSELPSAIPPQSFTVPIDYGICDPNVTITLTLATVDPTFDYGAACTAVLSDANIHVDALLPELTVQADIDGYCKNRVCIIPNPFNGCLVDACYSEIDIDAAVQVVISGATLSFDITEAQLETGGAITPVVTLPPGPITPELIPPGYEPEINCIAGVIADVVGAISDALEWLGIIDGPIIPSFESLVTGQDISDQLNIGSGLPAVPIPDIGFNEDIGAFMLNLVADLIDVAINVDGVTAIFSGSVSPTMVDPSFEGDAVAVQTPAPSPITPISGGLEIFLVLADDVLDQVLASLTAAGKLKTGFEQGGLIIYDLIPNLDDPALLPVKLVLQARNLTGSTPIVLHARSDVPPRLLIQDDPLTDSVEVSARLNDISVAMIADRNENGLDGELSSVPKCFGTAAPTSGDCSLFSACLDLIVPASLDLEVPGGVPTILTDVGDFVVNDLQTGIVCGAAFSSGDDDIVDEATASAIVESLLNALDPAVPPLAAEGFDLGGFVTLENPRLIAVDTDGDTSFQDFIGVTADISAP